MTEKPSIINRDTLMPLGLIITLVGAALSFGMMWQSGKNLQDDLVEFKKDTKDQLQALNLKVDRLFENKTAVHSATIATPAAQSAVTPAPAAPADTPATDPEPRPSAVHSADTPSSSPATTPGPSPALTFDPPEIPPIPQIPHVQLPSIRL